MLGFYPAGDAKLLNYNGGVDPVRDNILLVSFDLSICLHAGSLTGLTKMWFLCIMFPPVDKFLFRIEYLYT